MTKTFFLVSLIGSVLFVSQYTLVLGIHTWDRLHTCMCARGSGGEGSGGGGRRAKSLVGVRLSNFLQSLENAVETESV